MLGHIHKVMEVLAQTSPNVKVDLTAINYCKPLISVSHEKQS